jgi:UTP--glucose-1-phosphate uridylyltransferase
MTNATIEDRFQTIAEKMRCEGMPEIAIANFRNHYKQLLQGNTGFIPESAIQPVNKLPDADDLNQQHAETGKKALPNTVLLKLNGGLGTSMGLEKAKSLIRIKQQYSFLDIITQHAIHSQVHLLLMNSFNTREDSKTVLQNYQALKNTKLALDFIQHKVPKIHQHDFSPAISDDNKQLEWCPPGHGDIYIALLTSGMLAALLKADYRYALVSNADNLGAVLDTQLLGYMVEEQIPFLMEVTDRTEADKKGGHLAHLQDGRLMLRESAQCMDEDRGEFEDISKHRYFNTNNLWIDLQKLNDTLNENNNIISLPLIRNAKTVDPRDPDSSPVYQLETAMGSAISVFDGAQAIRVPRSRFAPVKTTNDLLLVRSDVYKLSENFTLSSRLAFSDIPLINLDKDFYKLIEEFETRFPSGPPSLLECESLDVEGDVIFGENLSIKGKVSLHNRSGKQVSIPSGTCVDKDMNWD